MQAPDITLVGFKVDGYLVDAVLSDGPFATVYSGSVPGERVAIKIAKLASEKSRSKELGIFYTKALAQGLGYTKEVEPDRDEILKRQAEYLMRIPDSALVSVKLYGPNAATAQYLMPFVEGVRLREQIQTHFVPHKALMDICRAMVTLEKLGDEGAHNDLKPENIILNKDGGITLLDPGYHGPIRYSEGGENLVFITTPEYYPYMRSDDLLAFGYILWECMVGIHPLVRPLSTGVARNHELGEMLIKTLETQDMLGNHLLEPLRRLPLPTAANLNVTKECEKILLRAVGLVLNDNTLDACAHYSSFEELYADLSKLDAPEIWETAVYATYFLPKKEIELEPDNPFGVKGLLSYVGGLICNRPFRFGHLAMFEHLDPAEEAKLESEAWWEHDDIEILVKGTYPQRFNLAGIFKVDGVKGVVMLLELPPWDTDEDKYTNYYVVRSESPTTLLPLDKNEFTLATTRATRYLETGPPFDPLLIENVWGKLEINDMHEVHEAHE